MTRREFEAQQCRLYGLLPDELRDMHVEVAKCNCGLKGCTGWYLKFDERQVQDNGVEKLCRPIR